MEALPLDPVQTIDAEDKTVARQLKSLKFTAPIGLVWHEHDATASMSLDEGLQLSCKD